MAKRPLRNFLNSNNIDSELMCIICREVFDDPHQVCCGHSFCFLCISIWQSAHKSCPICRKLITLQKPSKNFVISQIVDKMPCKCCYEQCQWSGPYNLLKSHQRKCEFKPQKEPLIHDTKQFIEVKSQMQEIQQATRNNDGKQKMYLIPECALPTFLERLFDICLQNQKFSSLSSHLENGFMLQATTNQNISDHHIDQEHQENSFIGSDSSSQFETEWNKLQLIQRLYPTTNENTEDQSFQIEDRHQYHMNQAQIIVIDSQSHLPESQDIIKKEQSSEPSYLSQFYKTKLRKKMFKSRKYSLSQFEHSGEESLDVSRAKKHRAIKKSKVNKKTIPTFIDLIQETD